MAETTGKKSSRLGRGLTALMGEVEAVHGAARNTNVDASASSGQVMLSITALGPNPGQPRRDFDPEALQDLENSIREKGLLQPILVRPDPKKPDMYQIIAGERRWRAAKRAGLETVPAMIRETDELELLELGIIENIQRTDLNPIEEAEAYEALATRFGRTQESLAQSVGKSRVYISNTLRLLKFSSKSRELIRSGAVSAGHARAALAAIYPDRLIAKAAAENLTVRQVEALARRSGAPGSDGDGAHIGEKKKTQEKHVDTVALEEDLMRLLGLTVDIRDRKGSGEVRIKYTNLEQLDEVCRRLTQAGR